MTKFHNNQPNVNDPEVREKQLMDKVAKIESKITEIEQQKYLMDMGVPSMVYDTPDELQVDVDFQVKELTRILSEIKFINFMTAYELPYSLN